MAGGSGTSLKWHPVARSGLGCRRSRLPLRTPGPVDPRLASTSGGWGRQAGRVMVSGVRLQGGQCPPTEPSPPPTPSEAPGSALGQPLSFAHRAGTPGSLGPPEWSQLGGISQSLLEQWLPPACLLRLGRAEGGGREGGGQRRKGKKLAGRQQSCVCIHRRGGPCGVGRARSKERPSSLCTPPPLLPPGAL